MERVSTLVEKEKISIAAFLATMQIAMLSVMSVHADMNGTVTNVWNKTFANVRPLVKFVFWAAEAVVAFLLVGQIIRAYQDYKRTGEVNWGPIIVLFIIIGLLIALSANNAALLWSLVGIQ